MRNQRTASGNNSEQHSVWQAIISQRACKSNVWQAVWWLRLSSSITHSMKSWMHVHIRRRSGGATAGKCGRRGGRFTRVSRCWRCGTLHGTSPQDTYKTVGCAIYTIRNCLANFHPCILLHFGFIAWAYTPSRMHGCACSIWTEWIRENVVTIKRGCACGARIFIDAIVLVDDTEDIVIN